MMQQYRSKMEEMQKKQRPQRLIVWSCTLFLTAFLFARASYLSANDALKLLALVMVIPALMVISYPVGYVMRVPRNDNEGRVHWLWLPLVQAPPYRLFFTAVATSSIASLAEIIDAGSAQKVISENASINLEVIVVLLVPCIFASVVILVLQFAIPKFFTPSEYVLYLQYFHAMIGLAVSLRWCYETFVA